MSIPTVTPKAGFNAEEESEALRKAMKGFGTDEKAMIDVVTRMNNAQRQEVVIKYKTMFGRDLVSDIKSEISGDFENTVLGLFMKPDVFDAYCLHKAIKGLGTKDKVLVEIMCSRTNAQIQAVNAAYKKEYGRKLEEDIKGDTSGDYEKLLVSLCQGARDEKPVDDALAAAEAQKLYEAGEKKLGTDESTFNHILACRSYEQLRATMAYYKKNTGHDLLKAVMSEFGGNVQDGMATVVKVAHDPTLYFAECLHKAMAGAGTDEDRLVRVIVSRSEIDLGNIKQCFQRTYGKPLSQWIKDDCGGDFKRVLLAVVKD